MPTAEASPNQGAYQPTRPKSVKDRIAKLPPPVGWYSVNASINALYTSSAVYPGGNSASEPCRRVKHFEQYQNVEPLEDPAGHLATIPSLRSAPVVIDEGSDLLGDRPLGGGYEGCGHGPLHGGLEAVGAEAEDDLLLNVLLGTVQVVGRGAP